MKRFLHRYFIWMLLGTLAGTGISTQTFAEPMDSGPTLILQVFNIAKVPNDVLLVAKEHVQRIYGQAHIQTVWLEEAQVPFLPEPNTSLVNIVLAPESVAGKLGDLKMTVAGYALGTDGQGVRSAYVFAERAKKLARNLPDLRQVVREGLVLGHVIAHEAGHLMLPSGHSITGIMRARMDGKSLQEALHGDLYFTSNQGQLIRTLLGQAGN